MIDQLSLIVLAYNEAKGIEAPVVVLQRDLLSAYVSLLVLIKSSDESAVGSRNFNKRHELSERLAIIP